MELLFAQCNILCQREKGFTIISPIFLFFYRQLNRWKVFSFAN